MDISYGICQACGNYTLIEEHVCEPCWHGVLQSTYQTYAYGECATCGAPKLHEDTICLHAGSLGYLGSHFGTPGELNYPDTTPRAGGVIPFIIRVGTYSGDLKTLVIRYKKTGVRGLAKPIAALMSREIDRVLGSTSRVAIVPVPCSEHSRRTRGWDHMVLVAKALSAKPNCMLIQLLERQGRGELKTMGKLQRKLESSRLYRLRNNLGRRELALLESCTVALVIDDVMTTGSTLGTCLSLVAGIVDIRILGLCLAMD